MSQPALLEMLVAEAAKFVLRSGIAAFVMRRALPTFARGTREVRLEF